MLCLPPIPQYTPGQYNEAGSSQEGYLYRSEYNTATGGVASMQALHGQEVPCAVCRRASPTAKSLMVPGQITCPSGFTADFQGYLFAPSTGNNRGDYLCMDANAEGVGSSGVENGNRLSPVEVGTGSAAPEYYSQGYEVACVHCGSSAAGSVYTRLDVCPCPIAYVPNCDVRFFIGVNVCRTCVHVRI